MAPCSSSLSAAGVAWACFSLTWCAAKGRERCFLRRALEFGACWAGGASPPQASPPHLGWAEEWGLGPPCSAGSSGCSVRGTEEYPHYPSFRSDSYSLLYKRSSALGCGFGSIGLTQFPLRLAAPFSKRSVHPQTLVSTFPGSAPGTVPACG